MKKKVLFLIESLSGGGAEKVLSVILRHLDKDRYEINVCSITDTGVYREEVKAFASRYSSIINSNRGPVHGLFNRLKYKLVYSWLPMPWVYKFFIPKGNDVEIAFCEGFVTKLLSQSGSKTKKIAWVHTDLAANPWPLQQGVYGNKEEEHVSYLHFDQVICVSKAVEDVMRKDYGLGNTTVIYNPVDADRILSLGREECPVKMDPSDFNIVAVGRLVPQKGFDELVRVVTETVIDNAHVHLYIIGEGPERPRLEEMITARNASDNIHLTGFLANPYALMSRADLYVCSSWAEGFSLTVAEAMVLEMPIISMNSAGPSELLEGGKFGEICSTYNDLSEAIGKAVSEKAFLAGLRKRMGEGRLRFSIDKTIAQIEGLLDAV